MIHEFNIGERVRKDSGDYTFEGNVVSVFRKRSQAVRYVVEDDRGLLFIFNEASLKRVPPTFQTPAKDRTE